MTPEQALSELHHRARHCPVGQYEDNEPNEFLIEMLMSAVSDGSEWTISDGRKVTIWQDEDANIQGRIVFPAGMMFEDEYQMEGGVSIQDLGPGNLRPLPDHAPLETLRAEVAAQERLIKDLQAQVAGLLEELGR